MEDLVLLHHAEDHINDKSNGSTHSIKDTAPQSTKTFLRLMLQPGISPKNFVLFLVLSFSTICCFVFVNAIQPFLLGAFDVDRDNMGQITGTFTFADQLYSLVLMSFWGTLSDRIGRRYVAFIAFLTMGVALFITPHAATVFPGLLLLRLFFAQGGAAAASMMTALLADYVMHVDKGKAGGLMGLMSGLGAVFAVFVFVRLPESIGLASTFYAVAVFCLLIAALMLWGLKPSLGSSREGRSLYELTKSGISACRDPGVILAYAASFTARGDSMVVTVFISLWTYTYYMDTQKCDRSVLSDPKSCPEAYRTASILSGIAQTCALVAAPLIGFLLDRTSRVNGVILAAFAGILGYGSVYFISNPASPALYGSVCLIGVAEIAMIITSQVLVTQRMRADLHGSVSGAFSFVGGLGILVGSQLGGFLFDKWTESAPFIIFAVLSAGVTLLGLLLRKKIAAYDLQQHSVIDNELDVE
eukprot:GILK01011319.1.p1 GENE.GILK01011319.1~~GILK01011319.1.p1  ORF type:complete len:493 (-),score=44.09 GILK01011319.1:520-1935(-)